eukprot:TRINITY_DN14487_c0_g1_i1.p1 TRINITY_DN14487_c0_g1~~TRINITY_DN14487_c0_g1_i1.p1  ORF type:complete len:653 (+),score=105.65 TRINITY_DN14487_c0_g1_i1:141-1961(+)
MYVAMSGLEGFVVILLLLDSPVECAFTDYYQSSVVPVQIITALLFQIVSGFITDLTARSAHRVLTLVCLSSMILEPIMFFKTTTSPHLVLITFVIRFGLIVQSGNSVGKLIKMRLDRLNMSEENQVHVFNNTAIAGDVIGRMSIVVFGYFLSYMLINFVPNIGFERIKIIFFSIAFFWDCLSFTVSLFIDRDYFWIDEEDEPALQEFSYTLEDLSSEEPAPGLDSLAKKKENISKGYGFTEKAFEDESGKRVTYQELHFGDKAISRRDSFDDKGTLWNEDRRGTIQSVRATMDEADFRGFGADGDLRRNSLMNDGSFGNFEKDPLDRNPGSFSASFDSGLNSFEVRQEFTEETIIKKDDTCSKFSSVRMFFGNGLLWTTTLHLLVNALVAGFVAIVLRFDVNSNAIPDGNQTKNNFCGGQFTSLLELQALSDCVRLAGSFFYQGVITRMTPYTFYTSFYMTMTFISMCAFGTTFFTLPSIVSNIILSYLNVAAYLTTNYDNSIIGAVVPAEIVGFSFAVQGVSIQLIGFIPVGLAELVKRVSLPGWSVTTILTSYIFFTLVYGFLYVKFQKHALIKLESPKKEEDSDSPNCLQRLFNTVFSKFFSS